MGDAFDNCTSIIWLEKMVWETYLRCVESSAYLLDVVNMEGMEWLCFLRMWRYLLISWSPCCFKPCLIGLGLGFTHCTSIVESLNSL